MTLVTVLEKGSDQPGIEKGYITKKLLENTLPENKHDLYYFICGPLPMIHAMESILHHLKVPHHQIISEKYEMA
jgi:predicted ferric reductase